VKPFLRGLIRELQKARFFQAVEKLLTNCFDFIIIP
jgi:hypothetical protein